MQLECKHGRGISGSPLSTIPAPSARPLLSVIIVSYNTRGVTLKCLRVLYAEVEDLPCEIFVVDNASTDGSPAAIRAAFPQVRLIENAQNLGFGAANNQALRAAAGEFLLLLNSDAFPEAGAIQALIDHLRGNPEVGVVGPRLLNPDGSLQLSCFRFPSPAGIWLEQLWISALFPDHPRLGNYRRWAHDRARDVDFVIGACMLVRRAVYERVGGFDERYFLYAEETDWQKRMHDQGWRIAFTPDARVMHIAGASGGTEKVRINRHFFDGMERYIHTHYGRAGLLTARMALLLGCAARVPVWAGVLAFRPGRRDLARSKVRLLAWLCARHAVSLCLKPCSL